MYVIVESSLWITHDLEVGTKAFHFHELAAGQQRQERRLCRWQVSVARLQRDHELI
jgi:hypothetical protein